MIFTLHTPCVLILIRNTPNGSLRLRHSLNKQFNCKCDAFSTWMKDYHIKPIIVLVNSRNEFKALFTEQDAEKVKTWWDNPNLYELPH